MIAWSFTRRGWPSKNLVRSVQDRYWTAKGQRTCVETCIGFGTGLAEIGSVLALICPAGLVADFRQQYNNFQPEVDSNPIADRVRRKRQRLPSSRCIKSDRRTL
jgi:hypothetical protein